MGKIQYPPSNQMDTVIERCFVYGEPLEVDFAVSGYFSHDNPIAFEPEPPTGNFVAPLTLTGYQAIDESTTVTFSYFAAGQTYKYEIKIKDRCPE